MALPTITTDMYTINRITLSVYPKTETPVEFPSPNEDQSAPGEYVGATRTEQLLAHVDFGFPATNPSYTGAIQTVIDTISVTEFDSDGNVSNYTPSYTTPKTYNEILQIVDPVIKDNIVNYLVDKEERALNRKCLHEYEQIDGISQIY